MDTIDRQIIIELQKNPRMQNTDLAAILDISEATVRRRIDDLVSSGTILLTALPKPERLGYPIMAFLGFRAQISRVASVAERLCDFPELHYVSICAGRIDIISWGLFRSNEHLSNFMAKDLGAIKGIIGTETLVQLRQIKRSFGRLGLTGPTALAEKYPSVENRLERLDFNLIIELQKNARRSNRELASILRSSEATIRRRTKFLVEFGIIELTCIPIAHKLGYMTRAFIGLQVELSRIDTIAEQLAHYQDVNYIGICSGPDHILIGVLALSPEHLSEFLTNELGNISGIITTESMLHLKTLKRTLGWLHPDGFQQK